MNIRRIMVRKLKEKKQEVVPIDLQIAPRKPGRPTLYRPEMCDIVVKVAMNNGFHAAMQLACGVSETQFYEWKKTIPEFAEAVAFADTISLALLESTLIKNGTGELRGNVNATLAALNNKYKAHYSRTATSESHEITINNNTLNLTSDQMTQKIAQKLEKFRSLGLDLSAPIEVKDE